MSGDVLTNILSQNQEESKNERAKTWRQFYKDKWKETALACPARRGRLCNATETICRQRTCFASYIARYFVRLLP